MTSPYRLIEACRHGRFLVPARDRYMGRALETYGEYSQLELDLLLRLIEHSGGKQCRVISCGANMGAFVVPMAQVAGELVAFEPCRNLYQLCCANVALNGLTNVRAHWAAVGRESSTIRIPNLRMDQDDNYGGMDLRALPDMVGGDTVPVVRLDDLPNAACMLIQMDVEGMEHDILLGAERLIAASRPYLFFEAERADQNAAIRALLEEWRYEVYWYQTTHYNPDNWQHVGEDIWAEASGATVVTTNALAIPSELGVQLPLMRMEAGQEGALIPQPQGVA